MAANSLAAALDRIRAAETWNERVEEIRRVPEVFGQAQHQLVYAAIAEEFYRPDLSAQFAYLYWHDEYNIDRVRLAYDAAQKLTDVFSRVLPDDLERTLLHAPATLLIFRLIVGYTSGELAATASTVALNLGLPAVTKGRIQSMERGGKTPATVARVCAQTIHRLMTDTMWEEAPADFDTKLKKPDTERGWETVRRFATGGVPYPVLLHQRLYGGPFRTLLDATSGKRGELLEEPLEQLLTGANVPFIRTGAHNQREIASRFNLTVRPAPDFVIHEGERTLRAIIECKIANDGGTARDKAARFSRLRTEAARLGGVPVIAVLDGLGWSRTPDALGPVIRDTDGRVFTLKTLGSLLMVEPFPRLMGQVTQ